jgi:hypothetical protein
MSSHTRKQTLGTEQDDQYGRALCWHSVKDLERNSDTPFQYKSSFKNTKNDMIFHTCQYPTRKLNELQHTGLRTKTKKERYPSYILTSSKLLKPCLPSLLPSIILLLQSGYLHTRIGTYLVHPSPPLSIHLPNPTNHTHAHPSTITIISHIITYHHITAHRITEHHTPAHHIILPTIKPDSHSHLSHNLHFTSLCLVNC